MSTQTSLTETAFLATVRKSSWGHVIAVLGVMVVGALIDRSVPVLKEIFGGGSEEVRRTEHESCTWVKLIHEAMSGARDGLNPDQLYPRLVRFNTEATSPVRDADALRALTAIARPLDVKSLGPLPKDGRQR